MHNRSRVIAISLAATLIATACDGPTGPPIAIEGGGFIFNYRIAEVFYGVSVKPLRRLDAGSTLEAEFEDPAGGPPIRVRETIEGPRLAYTLRTPPVEGVTAGRDYRVVVLLRSPAGAEVARVERTLRSDLDQEINPAAPLTVGPGYTPSTGAAPPRPSP